MFSHYRLKDAALNKALICIMLAHCVLAPGLVSTAVLRGGDQNRSLRVGTAERKYILHLPPSVKREDRMPMLIVLHGGGGSPDDMLLLTRGRFNTLADGEGFVVVYPHALRSARGEPHWNDGRDARFSDADDVGFLSAVVEDVAGITGIDRRRVYATGYSNGAQMCMRLARELPDKIASVALVAYAMPVTFDSVQISSRPMSVMIITGTSDPLLPWEGGETPDPTGQRLLGRILSVRGSAQRIAVFNHCSLPPTETDEPVRDPRDGTRCRMIVYRGGDRGSEVVLFEVTGGGHTWPGGSTRSRTHILGKTSRQLDACEVIWRFLKAHPKP